MANLRQGFYTKVKSISAITDLLNGGTDGVYLAGRVTKETPMPCIAIRDLGDWGGIRAMPFGTHMFMVFVYDEAPGGVVSYVNIDPIADALRQHMDEVVLTVDGNEAAFLCRYDNYRTTDAWDDTLEAPYTGLRFRVPVVFGHRD